MANERKTENIVRDHFNNYKDIVAIEEQSSDVPKIDKLLKLASKKGSGKGRPEFIIRYRDNPDFVIVVECKADPLKHESRNRDRYSEYAVDGALLYASYLSKEFDVLAIAVSGEDLDEIKVSHFLQLKGDDKFVQKFSNQLLSVSDYFEGYIKSPEKFRQDYDRLIEFSKKLNEKLHGYKIVESDRALLISCILIALENRSFIQTYKNYINPDDLAKYLVDTVEMEFKNALIQEKRLGILKNRFTFIRTDTSLSTKKGVLSEVITDINENIKDFIKTHEYFDVLGQLYIEFLRYANSDKGLGIVLTPPHITEFMAELAEVNKESVVYDNCTGTGGFLVSAMKLMITDAKEDLDKIKNIKQHQLIGVEYQAHIFALACSNMFIHQDGKSNILKGSCFDKEIIEEVQKYRPTVGLLNPPYKTDKSDIEELEFILNNLECIEQGGKCVAIVPMSSALAQSGVVLNLKEKLLSRHTLEAVMSMPNELFHNSKVGVVSCIMVFTSKRPHPQNKKVFFGAFKEDGFIKEKNNGRIDSHDKWTSIKESWLTLYQNKEVVPSLSTSRIVSANDEWCAEEFMDTNYDILDNNNFKETTLNYMSHCIFNESLQSIKLFDSGAQYDLLNFDSWKEFKVSDVFEVSLGKPLHKNAINEYSERYKFGWIPYVTRTTNNNAVELYVNPEKIKPKTIQDGLCITVGAEGFQAFYQQNRFVTGNKVNILRNEHLNQFNALFINTVLNLEFSKKFNYGRGLVKSRLEKLSIRLPEKNNEPDYEYMENYIRGLSFGGSGNEL